MHQTLTSVSELTESLRGLYFFWLNAKENGQPPRLSRLNLHQAAVGMDRFVITEILRRPTGEIDDFQFIYVGRFVNGAMRQEMVGHRLRDDPERGPGSQIWAAYSTFGTAPEPHVVSLPYVGPNPTFCCTQELMLPLNDDDNTQRFVLVGVEFRQAHIPPRPVREGIPRQPCGCGLTL